MNQNVVTGAASLTITIPGANIPSFIPDGTYAVQIVTSGYLASDSAKTSLQLHCYNFQLQFKKAAQEVFLMADFVNQLKVNPTHYGTAIDSELVIKFIIGNPTGGCQADETAA